MSNFTTPPFDALAKSGKVSLPAVVAALGVAGASEQRSVWPVRLELIQEIVWQERSLARTKCPERKPRFYSDRAWLFSLVFRGVSFLFSVAITSRLDSWLTALEQISTRGMDSSVMMARSGT